MRSCKVLFFVVIMLCTGIVNADCDPQTELRDKFDYYESFDGALRVRVSGELEGLKLTQVNVRAVNGSGEEQLFPVEIPLWIDPREVQPFRVPEGLEVLELEVKYSDGCKEVVYRQQFQEELISSKMDEFVISWAGKGFNILYSCFTPPPDKTIHIR